MSDVRDFTDYNEQAPELLTFSFDSSIVADPNRYDLGTGWTTPAFTDGVVVGLVSDSTVGLGVSGGYPLGKLVSVQNDKCSVQVAGTMQFAVNSVTPPIVGRGITLDGAGKATYPGGGTRLATERGIVLSIGTDNLGNTVAKVMFGN